ncbi:uncharacterized protein LOC123531637 isoform X3 [Mercenaria mercenaria]|uniref:uncharacterized protein LOC123531637 isoform X3 n=1 Tax=Mercenaria mercenaria TaxID=6596 RepID=UPI00234F71CF|nr:uncharacterized protein LOC123531637 isoform X3 [Mercenaria mercenaria]
MGVQGDYKKAAKLVKLRLTKSSDTTADKSFANVPLSQCINYNIEKNLRSNAVLTSNINLSEKLAQQLKEMSNDPKTSALHHGENKPDASTEAINLPPLSDSTLSLNEPKSTNGKVEENVNNLPDIHTTSTNENGPAIPRQLGQDHNVSEQSNSEFHDLPHISIKSFPNKAPRKESSKTAKIQDEEGDQLNRGAAVRAATCTSPYMFDKSDPQKLQLKARPLPSLHKVCTSCGGISACQERTGKQKRKSKHNEKETKSKVNHVRCCKSYVQDKWKLDGGKYGHSLKCSSIGIDKPTNRPRDLEQKQLQKPQLILSPTKTRPKCEEMSIDFMDKSIKFRFQCDVSVENNGQDEEVQTVDKAGKWLNNISTPTCKDCYQCPIATETRIYKDKVKGDNYGRETTPQPPPSSPYLDYCKSKAKMIAKKKEQFSDHIVYLSDTCLTEDVYMKAAKKIKRFPVIPKKKSKDNLRAIKRQTSNVVNSGSPRPGSDIDLNMKSTKPARLRGMKTSPYNISKENCNNNGQTQTLFHDDSKHYYCQEDHC